VELMETTELLCSLEPLYSIIASIIGSGINGNAHPTSMHALLLPLSLLLLEVELMETTYPDAVPYCV